MYVQYDTPFTRERILEGALELALIHHVSQLTRREIAEHVGCSRALVSHHCGEMGEVRESVVALARKRGKLRALNAAPFDTRRGAGRNGPVRG